MSAANGRGKCPNQTKDSDFPPENQKRTIHLLQNRTNLLALNSLPAESFTGISGDGKVGPPDDLPRMISGGYAPVAFSGKVKG